MISQCIPYLTIVQYLQRYTLLFLLFPVSLLGQDIEPHIRDNVDFFCPHIEDKPFLPLFYKQEDIQLSIILNELFSVAGFSAYQDKCIIQLNKSIEPAMAFNEDNQMIIAYNRAYYESIINNKVVHYLVLAHEITHHIYSHTFKRQGSDSRAISHKYELSADWYSGYYLGKLNKYFSIHDLKTTLETILAKGYGYRGKYVELNRYPCIEERKMHLLAGFLKAQTENWELTRKDAEGNRFLFGSVGGVSIVKIQYLDGRIYIGSKRKEYIGKGKQIDKNLKIYQSGFGILFGVEVKQPDFWNIAEGLYIGYFDDDHKQGYGTYYYPSNNKHDRLDRYSGIWYADKKSGKENCRQYWLHQYYEGNFRLDKKQGHGTLFDRNGKAIKAGLWRNDQFLKH